KNGEFAAVQHSAGIFSHTHVEVQGRGSSRKTTEDELHTEAGTDPWGWLVTMILKSSGEAARSAISDWRGSGGRGCATAKRSRIEKMISSAGARVVSKPALRNCNKELFL